MPLTREENLSMAIEAGKVRNARSWSQMMSKAELAEYRASKRVTSFDLLTIAERVSARKAKRQAK